MNYLWSICFVCGSQSSNSGATLTSTFLHPKFSIDITIMPRSSAPDPPPASTESEAVFISSISNKISPVAVPHNFFGACTPVDKYEKLNRIGEGTYGIVYRARSRENGRILALKRIRMEQESEGMPVSSLREIALLRSLRHENIVQVVDVAVGVGLENIFMVMEYCEQDMGNLMDNMVNKGLGYREPEVKCLLQQLLSGLGYLHSNYIIHRDLKLSNLLLTSHGILKIADFGLARTFAKPAQPMTPNVVTLWYRAPELLFGEKEYTTAIDMWAVGCIFGELLLGRPLLPGKEERQQIDLICRLLGTPNSRIWPGFDKLPYVKTIKLPQSQYDNVDARFTGYRYCVRQLLKALLTYHPPSRIDVHKALRHAYFRESPAPCAPVFLPTFPEYRNGPEEGRKVEKRSGGQYARQAEKRRRISGVPESIVKKYEAEDAALQPAFRHFDYT
ncbi:Cyclin-dependent kinase 10 [Gaertneriomyces sp. JEL0708]|nr:Cyclin-dependent kinase 10 [Gaertneriomyces sp. JEL0708]